MKQINIEELKQKANDPNVQVLREPEGVSRSLYRVVKNAGRGWLSFCLFYDNGTYMLNGLCVQNDPKIMLRKGGYEDLSLTPDDVIWSAALELRGILDSKVSRESR